MTVPRRLSQLLELAEQGPTLRTALAEEVAELLTDWPASYPAQMRAMCETLLARAARDADAQTRAQLRTKLKADPELLARVLPREAPGRALIAAARGNPQIGETLAQVLGVAVQVADDILHDASGRSLAVAAKAAHLGRSDFSALALLCHPQKAKSGRTTTYAMLDIYDAVAASEATRALRNWRGKSPVAAAE